MMKTIALALILCGSAAAQGARIAPPSVDYSIYGSKARQMIVYQNIQTKLDQMERERYRRFRREVRRQNRRDAIVRRIVITRVGDYDHRHRYNGRMQRIVSQ